MKELSKEELLKVIDADIRVGEKIIFSQEDNRVVKAVERRIQAYKQIRQLIESQPEVDEEFIKHLAGELFYTDWSLSGYEDRIREMFKEAGLKIKEK